MKPKGFALIVAFAAAFALALVQTSGVGAAEPIQTLIPMKTPLNFSLTVDIPDPALNAALHSLTGVPALTSLTTIDLSKLKGTIDLSGKGISNPEGLEYCYNLTGLYLSNNNLSTLPPHFENLSKLTIIILEHNKFADFPAAFLSMPALQEIRFANNSLAKLPANIDAIANLWLLDVSSNSLTSLPTALGKLSGLKTFTCSNNLIKQLPKELFKAPALERVDASFNKLTEIPAEAKSASKLLSLNVQYNMLTKLPSGIGSAPKLQYLDAGYNALTSVDASLYKGNVKTLMLDGNRLTQLPSGMKGKSFGVLSVEWNYMDVGPGSGDRSILTSLTVSGSLKYENQLSPVQITSTSATPDSVKFAWKPLADGTSGGVSWKVQKFEVYDASQSPAKLLDTLDETATDDTISGLEAAKEYSLILRVYYELDNGGTKYDSSCDTAFKVSTLAAGETASAPAATATPEATATPTPAPVVSASPAPTSAPASAAAQGGNSGLMIALIAVGALVVIGLAALIVVLLRRKPQTIRIRR